MLVIDGNTTYLYQVKDIVKYILLFMEISEYIQEGRKEMKSTSKKKKKKVINISAGASSGHSKILHIVLFIPFNVQIIIFKSTSNTSSLKRK